MLKMNDLMQDTFGIYIHIPFCKQACHYCDFHFSTSMKKKPEILAALCKELEMRKKELKGTIQTIYFGGGTPSLLTLDELETIFKSIYQNYQVSKNPEITLEANPDDLTFEKISALSQSKINRLSIGVQSFFDTHLNLMNRAHDTTQAHQSLMESKRYFDNISVDLIYGIPGMSEKQWLENINTVIALEIPHISSYALTVEPRTALKKLIEIGKIQPVDDAMAKRHYELLCQLMEQNGYRNYEFSNFCLPGYESQNNSAYWEGIPYLGIGPSAHSFDGNSRSWNVSNNTIYCKNIAQGILPSEKEILTVQDRYNEYIMTGLRTISGVSLNRVTERFGEDYAKYLLEQAQAHLDSGLLILNNQTLTISKKGKFLGDKLSSDLFRV